MSNKRYTEEFRAEAVKQITDRGHSVADVAGRLGISILRETKSSCGNHLPGNETRDRGAKCYTSHSAPGLASVTSQP